jgi:hypothetical protein
MNIPSMPDYSGLSRSKLIANWFIYQAVWFACILSAAAGQPWLGIIVGLTAIVWHLISARRPVDDLWLVLVTGIIGGIWDSLLVITKLIDYPSGTLFNGMAPPWIILLWMVFATTFNLSLRWLRGRGWLAALFGLLGGPLAWWAGHQFGALILLKPQAALIALGLGWAILMPVLIKLAARFDRPSETIQ